jgi:hypothetical protein
MFGQDWEKAEATIVARDTKYNGDGSVSTYTFVADVRLPSGESFRATVHEPTIALDFWPPNNGDTVSVLVRPKDHKVKFDKDDDRISAKAFHAAQKRVFEDAQRQPAGTTPAAWSTSSQLPDAVANALAQLGIVEGSSTQVFTVDSADAQAAMAAFTHLGAPAAQAPAAQTPEARLTRLETLHNQGFLTAEEYAEQRRRILNEI